MKSLLLFLAREKRLYRAFMRSRLLRGAAWRFVAGEDVWDGVRAVQELSGQGIRATLDHLGENVTSAAEARAAADSYLEAIQALSLAGLEPNVSLKLTQMGLDISDDLAFENTLRVVQCAEERAGFVRLDMESSAYTQRTLDLFWRLWERSQRTGVVLQAYLRRTPGDLESLLEAGVRIRLCKGAYLEPPEVAFQSRAEVAEQYRLLAERLLLRGTFPALATHDKQLLGHLMRFVRAEGIAPERFEFQMLYGVRRDLQARIASRGYGMRVYVPYGRAWYPYLMRRLAERPANLSFVIYSLLAEARGGSGRGKVPTPP